MAYVRIWNGYALAATDVEGLFSLRSTCSAGLIGADDGLCTLCDVGTYSDMGDASCTACPYGAYAARLGTPSQASCTYCSAGLYQVSCVIVSGDNSI